MNERYFWFGEKYSDELEEDLTSKMGGSYPPNTKMRHRITYDNNILGFDVLYELNELGQRVFNNSKYPGKKEEHFILAGDSNTFGTGVSDEDTLAGIMAVKYPQYSFYNFGTPRAGPHNTLALMMNYPWSKQISETQGKMVYIFYLEWMTMRAIGTKNHIQGGASEDPWYEVENDKLVLKGQIRDKFISKVFNVIDMIDYFHWVGDLPKINKSHMFLTAKILEKMKGEYLQKFPKGKFTVAVSEYSSSLDPLLVNTFMSDLKKLGVEAVLIHKNVKRIDSLHLIDSHFNRDGQLNVANELSKSLIQNEFRR